MNPTELAASGPLLFAAGIAAVAGALSFASPCVIPLVPGYLAYLAGLVGADAPPVTPSESEDVRRRRWRVSGAALLFVAFVMIELRTAAPLMRFTLFRSRRLATANVVGVLWAAAMFAWFFLTALYLQLVLGYSPLEVGLAFLPGNLIMGVIFGLIYLRWRRVGPLVVAHTLLDVAAFVGYAALAPYVDWL